MSKTVLFRKSASDVQARIAVASVLRNAVVVTHGAEVLRLNIKRNSMNERKNDRLPFVALFWRR